MEIQHDSSNVSKSCSSHLVHVGWHRCKADLQHPSAAFGSARIHVPMQAEQLKHGQLFLADSSVSSCQICISRFLRVLLHSWITAGGQAARGFDIGRVVQQHQRLLRECSSDECSAAHSRLGGVKPAGWGAGKIVATRRRDPADTAFRPCRNVIPRGKLEVLPYLSGW